MRFIAFLESKFHGILCAYLIGNVKKKSDNTKHR